MDARPRMMGYGLAASTHPTAGSDTKM